MQYKAVSNPTIVTTLNQLISIWWTVIPGRVLDTAKEIYGRINLVKLYPKIIPEINPKTSTRIPSHQQEIGLAA